MYAKVIKCQKKLIMCNGNNEHNEQFENVHEMKLLSHVY